MECRYGGGAVRIENNAILVLNNGQVTNGFAIGVYGGGIYNNSGGTLTLNNETISGNTTGTGSYGGGIYNAAGSVTMNNVNLNGNAASGGVGGIYSLGTLLFEVWMKRNAGDCKRIRRFKVAEENLPVFYFITAGRKAWHF